MMRTKTDAFDDAARLLRELLHHLDSPTLTPLDPDDHRARVARALALALGDALSTDARWRVRDVDGADLTPSM